jgi:cysteinyl-tRNA synthetase
MALKIHNTMTRKKETFVPLQEGKVGMYACGVTVYDFSHIGHARAMVVFDAIQRYLKASGYDVTFVRNYTDIDDKIINRANEEGVTYDVISERYIKEFDDDMRALGVETPTQTPRATGHIAEMIRMVQTLIDKGKAYEVDGDVYFSVGSFTEYGKLSGKNPDDLLSGARVEIDERKRSPLDFALWKKSKEGEPWWDCPWGRGRPGWHIECSAMSQKYLGETFDIHGGGMDLVFPHHENEIAQAECTTGKPFARYWIHNGFVNINHEKMSKSLKNFLTIRDVLKSYHPEVVRLFLLSNHYRSPVDFSDQNLNEAKTGLERFYSLLLDVQMVHTAAKDDGGLDAAEQAALAEVRAFPEKFKDAMDDDFNTAAALGHLYGLTRMLNGILDRCKKDAGFVLAEAIARETQKVFADAGAVFGLLNEKPAAYFEKLKALGSASRGITKEEIEALIAQRLQARREKNWARADEIRNGLAEKGVVLKDSSQGTEWSFQES